MNSINKMLRDIEKKQRKQSYTNRQRNIPDDLWKKLKQKRICDQCKEKFNQPLYIHHIKPVSEGGTNTEENLQVVCWSCHDKIDKKTKRENDPKSRFNWWR